MNIPVYRLSHRQIVRNTAVFAAILVALVACTYLLVSQRHALADQLPTDDFVTTWKTDNPGESNSTSIKIATSTYSTYNYSVDWNNDGIFDQTGITGDVTHDFGAPGTYTIRIRGTFPRFTVGSDAPKLIDVNQWGTQRWDSMEAAFFNATNMTMSATDVPDLSHAYSTWGMFSGASSFNSDISRWDMSSIGTTVGMFENASSFNQDISHWNVSNVTTMSNMFSGATAFNGDISDWNTANVTTMINMFAGATSFNSDISRWSTSNVVDMSGMFVNARSFNSDISGWDVSGVKRNPGYPDDWNIAMGMANMFSGATSFNQDISRWNVSNVTDMSGMFEGATSFNQDISLWNTANVTTTARMFNNAAAFNRDISLWDTSKVKDMSNMFSGTTVFNQDISHWNTASVTSMSGMFNNAVAFNQDISSWNTANVTDMSNMFSGATSFNKDISHWNTSKVSSIYNMFYGASAFSYSLGSLDISASANFDKVLVGAGGGTEQADDTLRGWASQHPQHGVNIAMGYCTAQDAVDALKGTYGWVWDWSTPNWKVCSTSVSLQPGKSRIEIPYSLAAQGASVGDITTEGLALSGATPYALTCDQRGADDSYFKIGGASHNQLLLNTDLTDGVAHNQAGDGVYQVCIRSIGTNGKGFDTLFSVYVLGPNRVNAVTFGVDGDGGKFMTVNGANFLENPNQYGDALSRSLVRLNGVDLKFCAKGTGATAEDLVAGLAGSFPNIAQLVTDTPPCYMLIDGDSVAMTSTQVIILLPDTFDTTTQGTVSVNGSPTYTFNASTGGDEQPTAGVDGSKPLDQHPTIKPLPTFSGVATPGATVVVTVHSDPVVCTTTADQNGNWSCTLTATLPAGEHTVYVQVTNPDNSVENLGPYAVTVGETITNTTPTAPNTGVRAISWFGIGTLVLAVSVIAIALFGIVRLKKNTQ